MFRKDDHINQYCIKTLIGQGTQGTVYQALHTNGNTYALKVIQTSSYKDDLRFLQRKLAFQIYIQGQSIVKGRQMFYFSKDKYLIIATQLCKSTLEEYINKKKGAIDQKYQLKFMTDIADGLFDLHNITQVHRNLSLQNVLISLNLQKAKLNNVGNFKDYDLKQQTASKAKFYWAPQQFEKQPSSFKTNVWAAGICFLQLILGEKVFSKDHTSALKSDAITKLLKLIQNKRLQQLIGQMLSRDPQNRPKIQVVLKRLLQIGGKFVIPEKNILQMKEVIKMVSGSPVETKQFWKSEGGKKLLLRGEYWKSVFQLANNTDLTNYQTVSCAATFYFYEIVRIQQASHILKSGQRF